MSTNLWEVVIKAMSPYSIKCRGSILLLNSNLNKESKVQETLIKILCMLKVQRVTQIVIKANHRVNPIPKK
jgi:hypothetical protein